MISSTISRVGIPTGIWKLDKAHTRVGFAVKSLGITTVRGEFRRFDGALEIGGDLAALRAYGRVDATSVDTNLARRDAYLRSTAFLSAETHPELIFRSQGFEPVDDKSFRIGGDLSINGVTNAVELTVEVGGIESGAKGEMRIGLHVTGQVSREAFSMMFLSALGSAAVADRVDIVIDVAAVKEDLVPASINR